jgi:hypothetical protein
MILERSGYRERAAALEDRAFDEPVPRGRRVVTLKDAGKYTPKLPTAEHEAEERPVSNE